MDTRKSISTNGDFTSDPIQRYWKIHYNKWEKEITLKKTKTMIYVVSTLFEGKTDVEILYEDWRPGDIKVFDINNSRIKNLGLQFETTFEEGLEKTIQWLNTELEK